MIIRSLIIGSVCLFQPISAFACSQTNESALNSITESEKSVLESKVFTKYKSYKRLKHLNHSEKKWFSDYRKLVVLVNQISKQRPCVAFELSSKIHADCSVKTNISSIYYIPKYVCENYL